MDKTLDADSLDIDDIYFKIQQIELDEQNVKSDLDSLLSNQKKLQQKMTNLHILMPNLQLIHGDAEQLSGKVAFTYTMAEDVSCKVRQFDLVKGNVNQVIQRVDDVLDLKFCTDGVQTALHDEDFEQAAAHIHRFLSLDEHVLRMSADASEGSTLDTSFKLLHESQSKLKNIVHKKFDAAVLSNDVASVERFFKIFPLIGQHDEGLSKFSKYLCSQLSLKSDENFKHTLDSRTNDNRANVIYADALTLLFEDVARIVDMHQPLVETYYGPGRIIVMMEALQKECDRQARKIIENFKITRGFDKRVNLVQHSLQNVKTLNPNDRPDTRELDVLLTEITILNTRAELYLRFARRRIVNDIEVGVVEEQSKSERIAYCDKILKQCALSGLMQELICNYIMLEEFFMREMVVKAVEMDVGEPGTLTTSMVDDTFFIVKKCVRRALSSSSVDGVCAMLNHACIILEEDFREVLYSRLRNGLPSGFDFSTAYTYFQTSFQQGKIQNSDMEAQKAKLSFLSTLNNAEITCNFIQTLHDNLSDEIDKLYSQESDKSKAKLKSCLADIGAVSNQFKNVLQYGFSQLNATALKPRLKPWVDAFLSTSHNLNDNEFTNFEANDPWVQNFILHIDSLLVSFKDFFSDSNHDALIGHISSEITTQLEKAVMKTTFNGLGGLQFDKELRSLVNYLTSATTWTIRDKFARLSQISTILNLENVNEILDCWGSNSGPLTWRLTPSEVRQALTLRIDFRSEDIRKLKL